MFPPRSRRATAGARCRVFVFGVGALASFGCLGEVNLDRIEADPTDGSNVEGCPAGEQRCDGTCVDTENDSANCGGCGVDCSNATACFEGECVRPCAAGCDADRERCVDGTCVCRPGLESCRGRCVDLREDPINCGGCDEICGPGQFCGAEQCRNSCLGFPDECGNACVDLEFDDLNCGGCGVQCGSDEICLLGECVLAEPLDPVLCDTCPCSTQCDPLGYEACCYHEYADLDYCVDLLACP